jgi:hypothetical protein
MSARMGSFGSILATWSTWTMFGSLRALTESKAKGKITFSSSDGDNKGQVWSYVFDGLGGFEYFRNGISTELV